MGQKIPDDLLALLRCPKCRSAVTPEEDRLACVNAACGLRYPVKDGIPVMLVEEAKAGPAPGGEAVSRP